MPFAKWRKFMVGFGKGRAGFAGVMSVNVTPFTVADGTAVAAHTHSIPKNSLHKAGMMLRFVAWGSFAGDADAGTVNLRFGGIGGTVVATVAKSNGGLWHLEALITRLTGTTQAANGRGHVSNTAQDTVTDSAPAQTLANDLTAVVEADGTNASDIVVKGSYVEALTNG